MTSLGTHLKICGTHGKYFAMHRNPLNPSKDHELILGNLDAKRDWGYAKEYVECMWLMLQQTEPDDFVIASGKTHTVREFVEFAFSAIGVNLIWEGNGINEIGVDAITRKVLVRVDPQYFRPSEVNLLWGNPEKAMKNLGWKPKMNARDLARMMVVYDLANENYGAADPIMES